MAEIAKEDKQHVSIVICGHVDAGKSTTTGRLIFELDGISQREMDKLKAEADAIGKSSFAFAFYMDRQKDERARGVTISCTTKEFYTAKYHYTIIDAPGHRDFIKNMITGASQADVALLMVPADGNFTASIAKGNHKAGVVQGQTRQHARLINLLGVKQLIVGVNKMDCDVAKYGKDRYDEVANEIKSCLAKVGWKKKFIAERVPILPISGWIGDNLLKKSEKMPWWKGADIKVKKEKIHVHTLYDCLNDMVRIPERDDKGAFRVPVSGVYKIKGVGDVITGCVEQGRVMPNDEVWFIPTHTSSNVCGGKVFTVEMHHTQHPSAGPGDNVGMNVKGLNKDNLPQVGDIMIKKGDQTLKRCKTFTAQVQILDHPGQLKEGYTPIAYIRTGRSPVRMQKINWKIGKETGGQKAEGPAYVKRNEVAEIQFAPSQPFCADKFTSCEGLGRVAIMEGNGVVMLGKITDVEFKRDDEK
jgi:elongation factor 1-alpha